MNYINRLFSLRPYGDRSDEIFLRAVRENFSYQLENCGEYRSIAEYFGIGVHDLRNIRDISKLPILPTLFFKRNKIISSKGIYTATSFGTSGGNKSEINFDAEALANALKMSVKIAALRGLISPVPCHYIIMGYKPSISNRAAVTKTAFGATLFTPALSRNYILKYKNNKYEPDFDGIISLVQRFGRSAFPIRFMGFPSYTYFLMKLMDERGIRVKLPENSKIMLGGGWKQFYAEQTDKQSFYSLSKKVLGIDDKNIIEFFGAVEHPVLYCDCPEHHFHIPAYSRVIIRDVDTLKPLPFGKVGLVNLITPMVKATPLLSVMTDDLGVMHSGKECKCGISSPYLEIIGRIAPSDIKTCAAGAAQLLEKL